MLRPTRPRRLSPWLLLVLLQALGRLRPPWPTWTSPSVAAEPEHALAKPNIIFGLDDSGSMDFEVLLATNDGAAW